MVDFLFGVVIIAAGLTLAFCGRLRASVGRYLFEPAEEQSAQRLRSGVISTDASIAREHRRARRAMNDAAGQSWRNQFE